MNYTVSRNGQTYGPYTLDDIRRYRASGNVLPTDMAQSDSMPEWVPVSRLLGEPIAAPPPPPSAAAQPTGNFALNPAPSAPSPYAPAFNPDAYPDAPDLHWGILLVLAIVFSPFLIVWEFVIAVWLRKVQPGSRALLWYSLSYGAFLAVFALFLAIAAVASTHPNTGANATFITLSISVVLGWTFAFAMQIVARFSERASLLEHFNGPEPVGLQLSGGMTFFFGSLYFQYHLNRIKEIKNAMRFGRPRPF